jgi:hypothetical protein
MASVAARQEFLAQFRRAVLANDVSWVLANMDPTGWQWGDIALSAADYASEFRAHRQDYPSVFGDRNSYREWFSKCPEPWTTIFPDGAGGLPGEAYGITWYSQGCQTDTPLIRIRQQGTRIYIKNLTD